MTIDNLLNKARQAAIDKVWPYYLDICDGDEAEAKEWIKHERKAGVIDRDIKYWTLMNIYQVIKTIKKTSLMNESEKMRQLLKFINVKNYRNLKKKLQ